MSWGVDGEPDRKPEPERDSTTRLRALAHPVRLRILSLLTAAALTAAEVARELALTHANASYRARLLPGTGAARHRPHDGPVPPVPGAAGGLDGVRIPLLGRGGGARLPADQLRLRGCGQRARAGRRGPDDRPPGVGPGARRPDRRDGARRAGGNLDAAAHSRRPARPGLLVRRPRLVPGDPVGPAGDRAGGVGHRRPTPAYGDSSPGRRPLASTRSRPYRRVPCCRTPSARRRCRILRHRPDRTEADSHRAWMGISAHAMGIKGWRWPS
ncbi:winged helix-turn-helix domain-containing protein [Plantactinospora sp. CA-290183]|uniref:winged helix-turn-helix domain-containing protein n=1 Tax=Plantactinospora sp. CA-290183 TaxID=3240006 RepID=UPI003D8A2661